MIVVFYDGKCNLCSKKMEHYKKISPSGIFSWQDINQAELEASGITLLEGLKLLHVKDAGGRMHTDVDALIVIWRQLKGWRLMAFFISLPLIRQIARFFYQRFAAWRFKRLAHCQLALKSDNKAT